MSPLTSEIPALEPLISGAVYVDMAKLEKDHRATLVTFEKGDILQFIGSTPPFGRCKLRLVKHMQALSLQ